MISDRLKIASWALPVAGFSLLALPQPAQAILTYYVYESGEDVVVQAKGKLQLPGIQSETPEGCGFALIAAEAVICTGPSAIVPGFRIAGPAFFAAEPGQQALASSRAGITSWLWGQQSTFYIDSLYVSGTPIISSATIKNQTLASMGLTSTGLLGTWTLQPNDHEDSYSANDKIRLVVGHAPPAEVPGPLPLFGAGAALGFSRRLRRRVSQRRVSQSIHSTRG